MPASGPALPPAVQRLRRCLVIYIEPRVASDFDLGAMLQTGDGLRERSSWVGLLPHRQAEVELDAEDLAAIAALTPWRWLTVAELNAQFGALRVAALHEKGILVGEDMAHDAGDLALRRLGWHPLSALGHLHTRWDAVDCGASVRHGGFDGVGAMLAAMGPAPPPSAEPIGCGNDLSLPVPATDDFDGQLRQRRTCRNFDAVASLPLAEVARLLHRVLGAQGEHQLDDGLRLLQKNAPSAGALHPTEGYLLAQRVDGLEPGIYHYDACRHHLRPLRLCAGADLRALALHALAGQEWFVDAACQLLLTSRFERLLWKYRGHSKAYRAALLDAGHVSQLLYLAATRAGWGTFVTSAINDRPLEAMLGIDPLREGTLAIAGFGVRASERRYVELDTLAERRESQILINGPEFRSG
jgi:putative peptide maturation dehydrogenase